MDDVRAIESGDVERDYPAIDEPVMEAPPSIGSDERRMHVRAYNYWVSLLRGRPYPLIADLDPATVPDFGPHGVVLDFSEGAADPVIPFVGRALREEGGHDRPIERVSDVPPGSLLGRLTGHIDEIIANHAPVGFEAEFVNQRGRNMMYRGILMPFSSDGAEEPSIDAIYGVINWKEAPAEAEASALSVEVAAALRHVPLPAAIASPVWADGPNAAPTAMPALHHGGLFDDADIAGSDVTVAQRDRLRSLPPRAIIAGEAVAVPGADDFVLLVARRLPDGGFGVIAAVEDGALLDRALGQLSA